MAGHFRKILIANRGEIAVRVARTLQQMGITAVAVYSDADRGALHVRAADEAYPLEGNTSAETYLRGDKILEIAKRHGVEAIHPGYGFLSENDEFARACADAGVTFIGPSPQAIATLGDKIVAKETLRKAGVPVVPGWTGEMSSSLNEIRVAAQQVGYPVLIKAAAGGGGRGMRIVNSEGDLTAAWDAAQREAGGAFGDHRVFLEKYVTKPRHIEFQIFGDAHGSVVHLFERECSIQRRYQKIVEESPSPALSPQLRGKMGQAAVAAAKAFNYTNAGTVEFILDESGGFYFLEVNTRLQVEHPVTEAIVGYDLVRAQIEVAAGGRLPFTQSELVQSGHALECRVYAEDPAHDFRPSIGRVEHYRQPEGHDIRVDSGVTEGSTVTPYYDAMLSKLIARGRNREETLDRMAWALRRYVVMGVVTNIEFLQALIDDPEFRAGRLHTHFLKERLIEVSPMTECPHSVLAATAYHVQHESPALTAKLGQDGQSGRLSTGPWSLAGAWRNA